MFATNIYNTPFTGTGTEGVFDNRILVHNDEFDASLQSTTRALLYNKMVGDKALFVRSRYFNLTSADITSYSRSEELKERLLKACMTINPVEYYLDCVPPRAGVDLSSLEIINVKRDFDDYVVFFEENLNKFACEGWVRVNKVTDFYAKTIKTCAFVNEGMHRSILLAEKISTSNYHYLQCCIVALLPWLFTDGLSENEMALISSLREKRPEKYAQALHKIAESMDLRTMKIDNLLRGFEQRGDRSRYDQMKASINDIIDRIDDAKQRLLNLLSEKEEKDLQLGALFDKISSFDPNESELMEYFKMNKNISLEDVFGSKITFVASGYLNNIDVDAFETLIDNKSSVVYNPSYVSREDLIPKKDMERLCRAIFVDGTIRMRICAAYRMNAAGRMDAQANYSYGSEFDTFMPNTHIDRYACTGNYERIWQQLLEKHDYVMAIENAIASTVSLNANDHPVIDEFFRRVYDMEHYGNIRCLEFPDGTLRTFVEAAHFLMEEEKKAEEKKNESIN